MRCQTCGEDLREGARFCPTCGTPTEPGAVPAAPTVQIRRQPDQGQTVAAAPPPPASTAASPPPPPTPEPEPAPQMRGDPGAGYDPLGPSRPAPPPGESYRPPATARPAAPPPPRATTAALPAGITAPSGADWNTLFARLQRLARLDTSVFGEFYADAAATIPVAAFAAVVLVISALGGMIFISSAFDFEFYKHSAGSFFLLSAIVGTVLALACLVGWAALTMLLLRQIAGVEADLLGVTRVLGVALVPLVLSLLLFWTEAILALTAISFGAVAALAVIGLLESMDVKPGYAWVATLAGFAAFVAVLSFLGFDTRDLAPGFFAII